MLCRHLPKRNILKAFYLTLNLDIDSLRLGMKMKAASLLSVSGDLSHHLASKVQNGR